MTRLDATQMDTVADSFSAANELRPAKHPSDALLSNIELPLTGRFYPLGYPIEVVTNEPEVLAAAEETFGHCRPRRRDTALRIQVGISPGADWSSPPEPTRRQFDHLYSLVADPANQALLDLKTGVNFIWVTKAAISQGAYFRYNFLEKAVYLLLGAFHVTDLHAACLGRNGKGILLCGDSGAGKTTLAYACARRGWTYTSDDTTYLINDSHPPLVTGHCHRIRFRPAATELFPELQMYSLSVRMEGKPSIEVPTAKLPILNTAAETGVHAIVFLNRQPGAGGMLTTLPPGSATIRLRNDLYSAGEIRARHESILARFWNAPTFELRYCDLEDAIGLLDSLA